MRLAYVCADSGIPVFGDKGASVHVQEVLRALARRGVSIDVFAARYDGEVPPALECVRLHTLPLPARRTPAAGERDAIAANERLVEMLQGAGPFDVIYERYSLWSFGAMEFARARGVPALLEVNAPLIEEQAAHRVLIDRLSAERCASRAIGAASAVLAVSGKVVEYATRFARCDGACVVPNGVDPERCSPDVPPSRPAPTGVLTLGFTGSLKPWHGLDVLIEAFDRVHRSMPRSRLLIVGDGPGRADIERSARDRDLIDAVVFTGAIRPADVPGMLTSMDVAAAPYPDRPDFYFSPLKIFEYMAAGLPIAASRIGQIADIIEDGITGILCPPGDAGALADRVLGLFADGDRRRRLGIAARRQACAAHTWDLVASRILEIAASAAAGTRAMVGR